MSRRYAGFVAGLSALDLSPRKLLEDHRVRYVIVGGSCAVLYLATFAVLAAVTSHAGYFTWFFTAQLITMSVAFPLYRTWVFESKGRTLADLSRFASVWGTSMVASFVSLPFLVEVVGMRPVPSQVLAVAVLAVASYLGHSFVSFRHR
jgi:putative flippase GtrA